MRKGVSGIKFFIGLAGTILFRVIPLPAPNIEPIMATTLPFSKRMGALAGMAFAFVALVSWDFISGRVGMWTIYTGVAYAVVGFAAGKFFATRKLGLKNRLGFAAGATIFYDAATALVFGWQFGQPLAVTIAGQVPFTLYHLAGNLAAVAVLTPLIDAFIVENKALDAALSTEHSPSATLLD
ncbi:MAG: hypothetical protein V1708_06215 [Candidatus Micrarchaeota archaeon]